MSKIQDLTGQKFNKLTLISFIELRNHKSYWLCKCDCGKEIALVGTMVVNGYTKSCGCINHYKDIKGLKFGKLTVISFCRKNEKDGHHFWNCECECGNKIIIRGISLTSNKTISCGCIRKGKIKKDRKGERYGRWTVMSFYEFRNRVAFWLCKCDCGEEKIVSGSLLRKGESNSCGCLRKTDLIGEKFGHLTVISFSYYKKNEGACWLCKCDCGEDIICVGRRLENGTNKTCGCGNFRMSNFEDLTGMKFGKLTVVNFSDVKKFSNLCWLCKCDCGEEVIVRATYLKNGRSTSCGCLRGEFMKNNAYLFNATHRDSKSVEYHTWHGIKERCYNQNSEQYCNYGGRGIDVSDEWLCSYEQFLQDMGRRPSKNHSIERINNDKGYSKDNCKWATTKEQANNKRNNHLITYNGETLNVTQWSEKLNLAYGSLLYRSNSGWTAEKIFNTPIKKINRIVTTT
jgi:hypothetical protein